LENPGLINVCGGNQRKWSICDNWESNGYIFEQVVNGNVSISVIEVDSVIDD